MLLDEEPLIPGETAALRDDGAVRQVFVGFAQRSFVRPYKRVEPLNDAQTFGEQDIERMELAGMGQLVGQDLVQAGLRRPVLVQENQVEERERRAPAAAANDLEPPAPFAAAAQGDPEQTGQPDKKAEKNDPGAGQGEDARAQQIEMVEEGEGLAAQEQPEEAVEERPADRRLELMMASLLWQIANFTVH